ncbi:MAG: HAD family acid phosphatase [Candidatus Limnocylindrales bacterium]|jgi:nitroreductase|nr:HAD family acid phosphatase [Candidatus Limnocylindrales bacterium]
MAFTSSRRRLAALAAVLGLSLIVGGVAYAAASPAIQTVTPVSANHMGNIDVLRQQIRNYYGDPLGSGVFASDSNYAKEASSVAAAGTSYLAAKRHDLSWWITGGPKAIVLDVDDTTLATWNYEVFSNWAYNPTTNATYVNGELFPAVPGMVQMVTQASKEGYAIFWVTGRPPSQASATLGNLTTANVTGGISAGYPAPTDPDGSGPDTGLYTKPSAVADYPAYLTTACASDPGGKCSTIHYKSATRAHIESLGYDIVASFGDQYSDLIGGYADRTFKLPNPNYYLP